MTTIVHQVVMDEWRCRTREYRTNSKDNWSSSFFPSCDDDAWGPSSWPWPRTERIAEERHRRWTRREQRQQQQQERTEFPSMRSRSLHPSWRNGNTPAQTRQKEIEQPVKLWHSEGLTRPEKMRQNGVDTRMRSCYYDGEEVEQTRQIVEDSSMQKRHNVDAPRFTPKNGDEPMRTRYNLDTPTLASQNGDAPMRTRYNVDAPRLTPLNGDAPMRTCYVGDISVVTRPDKDVTIRTHYMGDAPVAASQDVDAPMRTRYTRDAPGLTRQNNDVPIRTRARYMDKVPVMTRQESDESARYLHEEQAQPRSSITTLNREVSVARKAPPPLASPHAPASRVDDTQLHPVDREAVEEMVQEIFNGPHGFRLRVKAPGFSPSDCSICVDSAGVLCIDATHDELTRELVHVRRSVQRRYQLAKDVDLGSVRAYLTPDEHLEILGDKKVQSEEKDAECPSAENIPERQLPERVAHEEAERGEEELEVQPEPRYMSTSSSGLPLLHF